MKEASKTFGDRLNALIAFRGYNHEDFARITELSLSVLNKLISNSLIPKIDRIQSFAEILDVDVCWLSFGQGNLPTGPESFGKRFEFLILLNGFKKKDVAEALLIDSNQLREILKSDICSDDELKLKISIHFQECGWLLSNKQSCL